jgi:hypothetical protein
MNDGPEVYGVDAKLWWMDHENLAATAWFMLTVEAWDALDIVFMLEKPWKFTDEYKRALEFSEMQMEACGGIDDPADDEEYGQNRSADMNDPLWENYFNEYPYLRELNDKYTMERQEDFNCYKDKRKVL